MNLREKNKKNKKYLLTSKKFNDNMKFVNLEPYAPLEHKKGCKGA